MTVGPTDVEVWSAHLDALEAWLDDPMCGEPAPEPPLSVPLPESQAQHASAALARVERLRDALDAERAAVRAELDSLRRGRVAPPREAPLPNIDVSA